MQTLVQIKRTTTNDEDFQRLVASLDHELWHELHEDQGTYDQYNKVPGVTTAVLLYAGDEPAACGCFKEMGDEAVEIKRMFVCKQWRGRGFSKKVLHELERWAAELQYRFAFLETSVHFTKAKQLYFSNGYHQISNYQPYAGLPDSVCMKKTLL